MRALLFTIWITADKSVSATLLMLEKLTMAQESVMEQGGARMINASLAGKSFSYELPPNWSAFEFINVIKDAYAKVLTGGANGLMTDDELQSFVLDTKKEVTDTMTARINYNTLRR